ncbi:MAG: metal-dependent transcriptional regulator [Desulfuromonadia bacterium]
MKLSEKAEEVLERMWVMIEEEGRGFVDADQLGLSGDDPAIGELVSLTLVEQRDGRIYFRPEGRVEGMTTIRRHRLAERLMMDVLDIRGESAEEKACQFEHLLNEGVDTKICTMLNHPRTCPHGKPIPPGECCLEAQAAGDLGVVPLTELRPGEEGEIAYLQTDDGTTMQKLMAMGVLPGSRIQLTSSFPSYIFRVGYSEFAIDSHLAREIVVRRK